MAPAQFHYQQCRVTFRLLPKAAAAGNRFVMRWRLPIDRMGQYSEAYPFTVRQRHTRATLMFRTLGFGLEGLLQSPEHRPKLSRNTPSALTCYFGRGIASMIR